MKQKLKRLLSLVLAGSMLLSMTPSVFANETYASGASEISFSAQKYTVMENEGTYEITIKRQGGNDRSVSVAFKAADFLATYGEDYVVYDADGVELPLSDGIAPEATDLTPTGSDEMKASPSDEEADKPDAPALTEDEEVQNEAAEPSDSEEAEPAEKSGEASLPAEEGVQENESVSGETTAPVENDEISETTKPSEPTETTNETDPAAKQAETALQAAESATVSEEPDEKAEIVEPHAKPERKSRGSSIMDAQAQYLNLPEDDMQKAETIEQALSDLHEYFESARGAYGIVTFAEGETEKKIKIKIFDNDKAEADKLVLFALMGVNGDENTRLAANPTAFLTIADDEKYETPVISPDASRITLTDSQREAPLTLTRSAGVDYYTSVTVSTVKGTAAEGDDYEKIDAAKVSFVPGETEKVITLSANSFDEDKYYGIRIESDGTCDVENDYVRVDISSEKAEPNPAMNAAPKMMLMAADNGVLGKSQTTMILDDMELKAGPSTGKQDGSHWKSYNATSKWTDYGLYEEYEDSGRTWISDKDFDLTGVDTVTFPHMNNGDHGGKWGAYHIFIEAVYYKSDLVNYYGPAAASIRKDDNHGWTWSNMNVKDLNDEYYFRFGARNDGYKSDNVRAGFGNDIKLTWRNIAFTQHGDNKGQYFKRYSYDYDTQNGLMTAIAFTDGGSDTTYWPGKAYFVDSNGNRVNSFYANANEIIKPVSENAKNNSEKDIVLEGVYLYTKADSELYTKNPNAPYNDIWTTDNTVWVPASGAVVNQKFAKELFNTFGNDLTSVKIMPKYKQKEYKLNLYNSDNDKTFVAKLANTSDVIDGGEYYFKNAYSGFYMSNYNLVAPGNVDQEYKSSYHSKWKLISTGDGYYNIQYVQSGVMLDVGGGASANGTNIATWHNNGNDAQKFRLAKQNDGTYAILTKITGDKSCVEVGGYSKNYGGNIQQWQFDGGESKKWYLEKADQNFAGSYSFPAGSVIKMKAETSSDNVLTGFTLVGPGGTRAYADDAQPHKLSLTLNENTNVYPKTERQGMNVAYMPKTNKPGDLTDRVYRMPSVVDADTKPTEKTDAAGNLNIQTVYTGMPWIFGANVPAGKMVKWTNGTGDVKDVNGSIDVSQDPLVNEANENTQKGLNLGLYNPVYGNIMAGTVLQNNPKYYYEFVDLNSAESKRIRGHIAREVGSFYEIAKGIGLKKENVGNTTINIAGTSGATDKSGYFDMTIPGIPGSGLVTVMINNTETGTMYPTTALSNYFAVTLPAYEGFKPKSLSVSYDETSLGRNSTLIDVYNDFLTIEAKVEDYGQLIAKGAKFYIYDGAAFTPCENDSQNRFDISFADSKATLRFNPYSVLNTGNKIYIAFVDQNGKEYKKLDLGYTFMKGLSFKDFLFPMLGSSLLEDKYESNFELIGDPLGDISLGKIGLDESQSYMVSPPSRPDIEYSQKKYSYGDFSTAFKTFKSEEEKEDGKEDDKSKETADNAKKGLDKGGKEIEDSQFKTENSFEWEFGVKAAFAMYITTRQDADGEWRYYFEEMDFLLGADFDVSGEITITLPIGMNVIVSGKLDGDITGIYQMKTEYGWDDSWTENKVEYSAESFGFFKDMKHVNRYVYLMLNPNIRIGLDIEYAIVKVGGGANFKFDMDFRFGYDEGLTKKMYGQMTYNFDYHVTVLSFNVYEGKTREKTVKLFSENANGPFDPDIMAGLLGSPETPLKSIPKSRAYLDNATTMNQPTAQASMFKMNAAVSLFDIDASEATKETELKKGMYPDSKYKVVRTGENSAIMVFLDDVEGRSDVNRTGLYYSLYDGMTWSAPAMIDDDGTLDDYPEAFDLGDKVLIAWSSANKVLNDNATVQEALSALDIKVTFFDKQSKRFSGVEQITHDTEEDYTADVMPRAAFDGGNQVILYYTKTEYDSATKMEDLLGNSTWSGKDSSGSPSVIASRFYDMTTGEWNDADYDDSILDEGLFKGSNWDKDKIAAYKENWYGQRFLDTRIDKTSGTMLRIVDTAAISYNGLSLYAWTVDWDKDLSTVDDRDVFMQIFDFDDDTYGGHYFTHIIRVTAETGNYGVPQFGRYDDNTYLFFSAVGNLGNGEDKNTSGIAYINITEPIKNDKFKELTENNTTYYKLQYTKHFEAEEGPNGEEIPAHDEEILITPSYAVNFNGFVNNFSVDIDGNNRMYLTWTDVPEGAESQRQVFTSIFDTVDVAKMGEAGQQSAWSEPFILTSGEKIGYSDIDTVVLNDKLYVLGNKMDYIKSSDTDSMILNEDNAAMVMLEHTPYSRLAAAEENALLADTKYIYKNTDFTLTSKVKNEGTKLVNTPLTFAFSMTANGVTTDLGTVEYNQPIGGGKTASASVNVPGVEELSDDLTFTAVITGEAITEPITETMTVVKEAAISSADDGVSITRMQNGVSEISVPLANKGNIDSKEVQLTLYARDGKTRGEELASFALESVEANSEIPMRGALEIPDSLYDINDEGVGTADLEAVISVENTEIYSFELTDNKSFNTEDIKALSKVEGLNVGSAKIKAKPNTQITITPEITGSFDEGTVKVLWKSDNSDVVLVNDAGEIYALKNGTANLTAYVIPAKEYITFSADALATKNDIPDDIPENLIKTATVAVTVSDSSSSHSGRGGGGQATKYNVSFAVEGIDAVKVNKDGTIAELPTPVKDGYVFEGWYTDEALTQAFTKDTKVTSDLKLYAKWTEQTNKPDGDGYVNPFKDVSAKDWFYESVKYVYENKLFAGVSADEFAPNGDLTRGMLVTVLHRAEGEPEATENGSFADVAEDSYYANAVAWAKENGIVKGITDTEFAPEEKITREQIAAIMFRYSEFKGSEPDGEWAIQLDYKDLEDISDWAMESVMYCKRRGIMLGNDNNEFKPLDNATRAETAAIVQRFLESLKTVNK